MKKFVVHSSSSFLFDTVCDLQKENKMCSTTVKVNIYKGKYLLILLLVNNIMRRVEAMNVKTADRKLNFIPKSASIRSVVLCCRFTVRTRTSTNVLTVDERTAQQSTCCEY